MSSSQQTLLSAFMADRRLAHAVLFRHRHRLPTTPEHGEMIDAFHGQDAQVLEEAFRGFGKSTIGEEAVTTLAVLEEFENCVIVSSTEKRAAERLEAIKHELENNEHIVEMFGDCRGDPWQAHKIVLQSGRCIQALGVGQAVRGIKHHEHRPDLIWLDDIEDEESVRTPEASHERLKWMFGTLMPVCAKGARIRVTGNRLSPDAVVSRLARDAEVSGRWKALRFPICYNRLSDGVEAATWPELYDMEWIAAKRAEYQDHGLDQVWASEYMCEAIAETVKPFRVEDYRVVPRVRTCEAVYGIWDPAKTSKDKRQQAHYGKAVASWFGNKLVVWKCGAAPLRPSGLIDDIFATEREFSCVKLGVEADGLEEWLTEPLAIEQVRRKVYLPHLEPLRAPRDKDSFIRSLQPLASAGLIEFAEECPEARAQMVNYPSGRKDALNALAYMLKLKPGSPVYEGFSGDNVMEGLEATYRFARYLILNADGACVTGVLAQYDGSLTVLADWTLEGDAGQCVETIVRLASLEAGALKIVVPPKEADQFRAKGVIAALRRCPRDYEVGYQPAGGRAELRALLERVSRVRATPLLQVAPAASWTIRALYGGYFKAKDGEPEENHYATLMEGLESFAGMMQTAGDETATAGQTRVGRDGREYRSLLGAATR